MPFAFGTPYVHSVFDVAAWGTSLATFWLTTRAISCLLLVLLTLGCILAVSDGNLFGEMIGIALLCGSPTLILGAVLLWVGTRRLR